MNDFSEHPIQFVHQLTDAHGSDLTLSFSKYFYRERSTIDEREIIQVASQEVTVEWFKRQLVSLDTGWDIALNSNVVDARGRTRHIPMIDFVGDAVRFFVDGRCRDIVGHRVYDGMVAYSSGRSLHAYSLALLSPGDWVAYMARLLLIDFPSEQGLIDHRWIGHRLSAGYAALRWSANGEHYVDYPRHLDLAAELSRRRAGWK